jgi:hypothetical protein
MNLISPIVNPGKNIHCIFCSSKTAGIHDFLQGVSAGGEGGIRTHDPAIHRIPLFESGAFSRSATSPALSLWIQAILFI